MKASRHKGVNRNVSTSEKVLPTLHDAINYEEDVEKSTAGLGFMVKTSTDKQTSACRDGGCEQELAKPLLQKPDVILLLDELQQII